MNSFSISRWLLLLLPIFLWSAAPNTNEEAWGFFGHRRINRLAVFTLPAEMIPFYKANLEFVTEHAVDPDKRRYATKHEAFRHYIDIDHWGTFPFDDLPRDWAGALASKSDMGWVDISGDTTWFSPHPFAAYPEATRTFFQNEVVRQYYEDEWQFDCAGLEELTGLSLPNCAEGVVVDNLSEYGIIPYYLPVIKKRLTDAFAEGDLGKVMRFSADIGHYIGDAHVPLHTTVNYNGQLTNQDGIHAFWESRLPELFADEEYDFFVGPAEYIDDTDAYFWEIVLDSHQLLDSVLAIEKDLSLSFPADQQFCYEERLDRTIRTQCENYARAFHERLAGQVESRMRASILAVGSIWYTCWVDAGKPDLSIWTEEGLSSSDQKELEQLDAAYKKGEAKGRKHE